jgi:hypothetical protein
MKYFDNGAPTNPYSWIMGGYDITPCRNKRPVLANWQNRTISLEQWEKHYSGFQIGLKLKGLVDFDVDNHFVKRFIEKYLGSSGAAYGRKSNPLSHYLFDEELQSKQFVMPKELESHFKDFPHGACLCEIRNGNTRQSIVPSSEINNEAVEWNNYSGIKKYNGDLQLDIGKIALSAALCILYPIEGARDFYCSAIAGVLTKHTNWSKSEIDNFVYNIATFSGKEDRESLKERMSKGTEAKNPKTKNLGLPTIAEKVGCSVKSISTLFSWVGVNDSGASFKELKVYETEPKYWQLKYKDTWITIMDSSILLSYTKVSILILENCYEVAPVVSPKDWKEIVKGLLSNVQKIDVPYESSYYNVIGTQFLNYLDRNTREDKIFLSGSGSSWLNHEDKHIYFKLEHVIRDLQSRRISFELRKLTHYLRENYGAEPTKMTISKKEHRVWKVHQDVLSTMNKSDKGIAEHVRSRMQVAYDKSKNAF